MENLNSIQKFYVGKTIFITGASGFMGKVLIEKLLYSCSDVERIFILMRPKRGKSAQERVDGFAKLAVFKRVVDEKPSTLKKLYPVFGDITQPNFGLSDEHLKLVTESTQIFFHMAASLKLEATLRPNIIMNLCGTKYALDVAKQMKKLIQMVHLSTAFCNIEPEIVYEKVYEFPHRPEDLMRCAEWMSEDAMASLQKEVLGPHPNTYTYTKRMAEILVQNEFGNLPVCIVRPTIVTPALFEPVPGWVDSLNGPIGIMYASGKGVLRTMLIDDKGKFENIPVDIAINSLVVIAQKMSTAVERPREIPVFHTTLHKTRVITFRELFDKTVAIARNYPYSWPIWYPAGEPTTNYWEFKLKTFFFQWIPAYVIDFFLMVFQQKPLLVNIQKRIAVGCEVLMFFCTRNWNFNAEKFEALFKLMTPEEHKMFAVDTENVGDEYEYIKSCILGARQYCVRDPLSTLPTARRVFKASYVIHLIFLGLFWYYVIKMMLKLFGLYDPLMSTFGY